MFFQKTIGFNLWFSDATFETKFLYTIKLTKIYKRRKSKENKTNLKDFILKRTYTTFTRYKLDWNNLAKLY